MTDVRDGEDELLDTGPRRRVPIVLLATIVVAGVIAGVVVLRHHPTAPQAASAPAVTRQTSVPATSAAPADPCRTTCESTDATPRIETAVAAAIRAALGGATHVTVTSLTSTAVPGTQRVLLTRRIRATVPQGDVEIVVSVTPAELTRWRAPVAGTVWVADAVVDDYSIRAQLTRSAHDGRAAEALRRLVRDRRLVTQR